MYYPEQKIWLLTCQALDSLGVAKTVRFSSAEYNEDGEDWINRIDQPALFTTAAFSGGLIKESQTGFGATIIKNPDGDLDYLADYAFDGREVTLQLYDVDTATLMDSINTTISSIEFTETEIQLSLRDPEEILNLPHPQTQYLGNNVLPAGTEGTADDIKGTNKPRVFGSVSQASPVYVNTAKLIYQVSDNPCTITAVYDRGVSLVQGATYANLAALEATPPAANQWRRYEGYFRLGSVPAGTVTCDAAGANVDAGDVFEEIASEAGFSVDSGDVTALNAEGEVGIYLTDTQNTAELLNRIAVSVGAYWSFDVNLDLIVKVLTAPSSPMHTFQGEDILSISRESTGAGDNGVPIFKVTVLADKVETVQDDLAASVPAAFVARVGTEYRQASDSDSAVKTRHLLSQEKTIESNLRSLTDAATVATRVLGLLKVRRDILNCTIRMADYTDLQIGDTVTVLFDRYGYDAGRDFRILGFTFDARRNRAELYLWG